MCQAICHQAAGRTAMSFCRRTAPLLCQPALQGLFRRPSIFLGRSARRQPALRPSRRIRHLFALGMTLHRHSWAATMEATVETAPKHVGSPRLTNLYARTGSAYQVILEPLFCGLPIFAPWSHPGHLRRYTLAAIRCFYGLVRPPMKSSMPQMGPTSADSTNTPEMASVDVHTTPQASVHGLPSGRRCPAGRRRPLGSGPGGAPAGQHRSPGATVLDRRRAPRGGPSVRRRGRRGHGGRPVAPRGGGVRRCNGMRHYNPAMHPPPHRHADRVYHSLHSFPDYPFTLFRSLDHMAAVGRPANLYARGGSAYQVTLEPLFCGLPIFAPWSRPGHLRR